MTDTADGLQKKFEWPDLRDVEARMRWILLLMPGCWLAIQNPAPIYSSGNGRCIARVRAGFRLQRAGAGLMAIGFISYVAALSTLFAGMISDPRGQISRPVGAATLGLTLNVAASFGSGLPMMFEGDARVRRAVDDFNARGVCPE
jgi:hypothetical protein